MYYFMILFQVSTPKTNVNEISSITYLINDNFYSYKSDHFNKININIVVLLILLMVSYTKNKNKICKFAVGIFIWKM